MLTKNKNRRSKLLRAAITSIAVLLCLAPSAYAASVAITWNANSESDLAGYLVLYGTAPGVYGTTVNVGNATSYTVSGLATGQYYFVVRAYSNVGLQSPPSVEVTATLAATAAVARITISPATKTLRVGETANLTAQAFDAANNPLPSVPLIWSTTNSAVASLATTTGATVAITAVADGTTSVLVTAGTIFAAANVTVSQAPAVSRVAITPASATLVTGQAQQFVALAYDSANAAIAGTAFTWTTTSVTVAPLGPATGGPSRLHRSVQARRP